MGQPGHQDTVVWSHCLHMSRECDLNVGQSALRLHVPQRPHIVNYERIFEERLLEALFPAP